MGRTHWGDPADPLGQCQERYSKATRLSLARLHRGPWQTSPGAMETTGDRRAGTQSRRGSPAKQSGPATQATRVRRSYRRLAGAIPLVVRDTPHGWAAPELPPKGGGMWPYPWTHVGTPGSTGDRRAGTQSRRGSPAKQSGPATQATRVRRSYRRLAGAIPLVVRDTQHGWAAPRAAAQRRGHVALPMDTCGNTWTGWPRQCLPKHMRERLKRHLT